MNELGFVGRCLAITVAIIFLMQIKLGKNTVEQHTLGFLEESKAVDGLRYVADGAFALAARGYHFGASLVGAGEPQGQAKDAKTENASRGYSWEVKRSDAYRKQQRHEEIQKARAEQGPAGDEVD